MTDDEIFENAALFTMAGSETLASELSGVIALLLDNPNCLKTATAEVRSAFKSDEEINFDSVVTLKYLLACLNEGMRCYPPVTAAHLRQVPAGGKVIDGGYVPKNVRYSTRLLMKLWI